MSHLGCTNAIKFRHIERIVIYTEKNVDTCIIHKRFGSEVTVIADDRWNWLRRRQKLFKCLTRENKS